MSKYPLHTTEYEDLDHLRRMANEASRRAIWVHVKSDEEREHVVFTLLELGWDVLDEVPKYFVLAVRPNVQPSTRARLRELVQPSLGPEQARFMGRLFGYSDDEIEWYIEASGLE